MPDSLPQRTLASARSFFGDIIGPAFFVVLGGLICQLGLGFGYAMKPLAGDIIDEFGWSRALYFGALAPLSGVYALSSLAVGALVVRTGARRILVVSILMLAGVFALLGRMQSWWHLSGLVVVMGIALTGLGDITVGQLVSQWVRRGRGLALGIVFTGSNLGGYLFIPLMVGIADESSWRDSFESLSLIAIFVLLPAALLLVRERPAAWSSSESPEASGSGGAGHMQFETDADLDLGQALRTRSFWILAFSLICFFSYFMSMIDHLVLHLTDTGVERREAAQVLRSALGMGIVSKILLGIVADRIATKSALFVDLAFVALSSLVLFLLPAGPIITSVYVVIFGFSTAARDVVYPLIVSECFGLRNMAPIYGGLMLTYLPGATLGPLIAAAVHDQLGSYHGAFVIYLVMNVLALAALPLLRDERRDGSASRALA